MIPSYATNSNTEIEREREGEGKEKRETGKKGFSVFAAIEQNFQRFKYCRPLLCSCVTLSLWPVSFCLCGPFNCISFHQFSRQLSVF